jgi:hypothetical protein
MFQNTTPSMYSITIVRMEQNIERHELANFVGRPKDQRIRVLIGLDSINHAIEQDCISLYHVCISI